MHTNRLLIAAGIVFAAGCSRAPSLIDFDGTKARETLIASLDAWKNGQAAQLSRRQPPIRFVDDDFTAGSRLISYAIDPPNAVILPFQTVNVTLQLRTRQGQVVQRKAGYQVSLQPRLAVLRADS